MVGAELHLPKGINLGKWVETRAHLEWEKECPYGCLSRQPIASVPYIYLTEIRMDIVGLVSHYLK